jgi:hypothetical protein
MRLAKLKEFRAMVFSPRSAPTLATLRAQIRAGTLPGVIHGGLYYVDLDEWDRLTNMGARLRAEHQQLAANPLLKGLL